MKKFLIILAVVLTAYVSQAAAALWKATGGAYYNGTGSTETSAKYTGTVYVFDNTALSQEALYAVCSKDLASYDFGKNAVGTLSVNAGSIVTAEKANEFNYGTGGVKYSFYTVLVDTDKIYFSNINSDITAGSSETVATAIPFSGQNNGTTTFSALAPDETKGFAGAGYWSVPEPASGLLLLCGIAGLMLRRKQKKA